MTYKELACIKHALLDASVLISYAKHLHGWKTINDEALKIVTLAMLRQQPNAQSNASDSRSDCS
jgi:hypothetical protein